MKKPAMENSDDDGVILATSSSVSELDVDAYFEKKAIPTQDQEVANVANESMVQDGTTIHTDSAAAGDDEQQLGVTFVDSQSYDVDEVTVDTNQAEGLDTVPSLEDGGFINRSFNSINDMSNNKTEDISCNSGSNSNCSTAEVTSRTRLETMDSTVIDCGYDIDHRSGTPLPPSNIRSKGSSFRKSHQGSTLNGPEQPAPPSECTQFARRIKEHWSAATKKLRDGMLYALVETSVLAAQWPRTTIAIVACASFALIAAGFFTNFHLRLDNERIFTPTGSEVIEHSEFVENNSLYVGTEHDVVYERRRQLSQARTLQKLIQQRKLKTTFNIFDEDNIPDEQYSFSTTTLNPTSSSPSLAPSMTIADRLEEDSEPADVVDTNSTEVSTPVQEEAENEEEEEIYYARGGGNLFPILVHQNTENVFTIQGIEKLFDLIDFIKAVPGYADACHSDIRSFHNFYGENTCEIRSITRFWNHNRTLFEDQIKTEEDLFDAADQIFYPDGGYADLPFVLAKFEEDERGRPVSGQAFIFFVMFKHDWAYNSMTDHLLQLQAEWASDPHHDLILEFVAPNSFAREAFQSVWGDLPLLPTVFIVMCGFTMLVFLKCHKVYSRCLLGVGAVTTIMMSIMSGYGLLFIFGVPITVMTNMLIFVIFGIGLDDTFIITGAYFRTNHEDDIVVRVRSTMEAVGSSILLTTITTSTAFILGCTSTIEPIRWLCLYAFPAIIIDFVYQITFFVAFLVLDEQRIQSNRMDCCFCFTVENDEDCDKNEEDGSLSSDDQGRPQQHEASDSDTIEGNQGTEKSENGNVKSSDHIADRFMRWFATHLMHPTAKILVMVVFVLFAGLCAYKTTQMRQRFNFKDLLPKGSYAASYADAVDLYSDRAISLKVTFRFVDQSDEDIRNQMERYVDELVEKVDALNEPPPIFWAREFKTAIAADPSLQGLPFYDQVRQLLQNPAVNDAIGRDIRWRDDGTILASQVRLYVTDLDMDNVRAQIKFLQQQRDVAKSQPINKGRKLWAFFAWDMLLHIFTFYEAAAGELAVTTATSVMAVCVIALVLIPHWSAVPIILPLLSVLYIEMLGILQMFGYAINVVTYVILVVSIGLLVDFIMHILLRYYESEYDTREEKVKDALGTMGASILVGGLSTFLGVTPLLFSASEILSTVCIAFLAMVFLGVTHGLIVLPVILSYVGTETVVRHRKRLSLVDFAAAASAALSEKFHQSMDFSHGRHHASLENCNSRSHESELQV